MRCGIGHLDLPFFRSRLSGGEWARAHRHRTIYQLYKHIIALPRAGLGSWRRHWEAFRRRLHGIDAPEAGQTCRSPSGTWRCGQKSSLALSDLIGRRTISCAQTDRDRYGRMVAICWIERVDLSEWMVRNGWAVAYTKYSGDYVSAEQEAAGSRKGVWSGEFIDPWDYRRGARLAAAPVADDDCLIKGNINRKGDRIYHVPGSSSYSQTKISPSKGERWFCTEEEAEASGWRAPRR